jgi:ligand-binding sensor domain-containing protein
LDIKTGKFKRYQKDPADASSISHNYIQFIHEDPLKNLWVGTYGGGLNLYDREKDGFEKIPLASNNIQSSDFNVLLSIAEDTTGIFWIGTENSGVISFNPKTSLATYYQNLDYEPSSINGNTINTITKDSKNNLWFGTSDVGINKVNINASKFNHYKIQQGSNSLSDNKVAVIRTVQNIGAGCGPGDFGSKL